jgi:hypothetical protein
MPATPCPRPDCGGQLVRDPETGDRVCLHCSERRPAPDPNLRALIAQARAEQDAERAARPQEYRGGRKPGAAA